MAVDTIYALRFKPPLIQYHAACVDLQTRNRHNNSKSNFPRRGGPRGRSSGESKRLLRKVLAALAEAEGMMMGAGKANDAAICVTASSIVGRTSELRGLLQ